jgi:uncharacterized protein
LWGPLLRAGRRPALRREQVETPDGDFVDLDWLAGRERGAPLVLILHGLEGSARSHYASGLLRNLERLGWRGLVLHFRSCGGDVNRSRRHYHSGDTEDIEFVVSRLTSKEPSLRLGVVGVSLGGNVILKWLGERGDEVPGHVVASVAISTPFNLAASAAMLDRGVNRRLYTAAFLSTMKAKLDKKSHLYGDVLDLCSALRARTFAEYDRLVTAPLNGFSDEQDYWTRSSSAQFLPGIRRPTLLINALNDPFMPASALPRAAVAQSRWLEADFVEQGGHAGFLEGFAGRRSWAEARALAFLRRHLLG